MCNQATLTFMQTSYSRGSQGGKAQQGFSVQFEKQVSQCGSVTE